MKLFRTTNMDTVKLCQEYFNFELPSNTEASNIEIWITICINFS